MTLPEALKARLVALVVGVKAEAARLGAGTGLVPRPARPLQLALGEDGHTPGC